MAFCKKYVYILACSQVRHRSRGQYGSKKSRGEGDVLDKKIF